MTINEGLWQAIEACVYSLPHKVEWFEADEERKLQAGQSARATVEMQRTFIVPHNLVDLFGMGVLFERCKELAAVRQCDFYKANDGSLVFRSRKG
jgi:hypothetical protein